MTIRFLNLTAFAHRIGMPVNTLKWHRRQGHLPDADAEIIDQEGKPTTQGWYPATADAWKPPQGPGQGARTDIRK